MIYPIVQSKIVTKMSATITILWNDSNTAEYMMRNKPNGYVSYRIERQSKC